MEYHLIFSAWRRKTGVRWHRDFNVSFGQTAVKTLTTFTRIKSLIKKRTENVLITLLVRLFCHLLSLWWLPQHENLRKALTANLSPWLGLKIVMSCQSDIMALIMSLIYIHTACAYILFIAQVTSLDMSAVGYSFSIIHTLRDTVKHLNLIKTTLQAVMHNREFFFCVLLRHKF